MGPRKNSLLVVAVGFALISAGCADDQANNSHQRQSHYAARQSMTGSHIPQAPAYGDGVADTSGSQVINDMTQHASVGSGGFGSGAVGGGAR